MISIFKALPFRSRIPSPRAICHLYSTQDWAEYHTDLPACQHCSGQTTDGFWSLTGHGKSLTSHCKHSPRQFHAWPQHTSAVSYFMCVFFSWNLKWKGTNNCLGAAGISNMAHSRVIQPYILVHTQATPVKQWCGQHWMPARFQLALTNGATVTCNIA